MSVFTIRQNHKRRYVILFLSLACFIIYRHFRGPSGKIIISRSMGLTANSSQFTLGGKPFRILGGSLHYFRLPRAYWRDRMVKMKACGLNTVTVDVPWSLHQPQKEELHFQGGLDLEAFLQLAADVGLWVILRPGPYIGTDLDLGGLPSWLLRDREMMLRTTYPGFIAAVNVYFDKLIPKVVPLQFKKGGPIIAVQVENKYGSHARDGNYMSFIKEALQERGISEALLTSDNHEGLKHGGVKGALRTLNLQKMKHDDIKYLEAVQPNSPVLVMELWTGRCDGWGGLHHSFAAEDLVSVVREMLRRGMSINLYMFYGGTNFGFMNGALANPSYKALVTSYDYDAPLSEAGDYTPKYHLLRDLFSNFNKILPEMPGLRWKEQYEAAILFQHLSLWDALPFTHEPFRAQFPVNMESLPVNNGNGQAYGYTLYETSITRGGSLKSGGNVQDRALVFVNQSFIGSFHHRNLELAVPDGKGKRTLSLLVENCGRVHSGKEMDNQRKGIVGDILLNRTPLRDFTIYSLDMTPAFINSLYRANWKTVPSKPSFPGFFQGRLFVNGYPSDTFMKLPGWSKGVVFVNGQNIGRYWDAGPQQALFLPGPFLNSGMNQVIVFEEAEADLKTQFEDSPDLGMTVDI
ncbi:beta-galactosidase-1-like protein 2 isoform X2 [Danio rerio]|uniref:Beta-galactosidase-1-like protein 2 isoform X2 n=2 Tax=Danio rerio TaxID=7955 RepID=A0AC58GNA1_DANRE|nr:beta-galactosidase-1-like protein 2 isoform X2 [Danio rerio]|eukprot:XP_021335127.1 beta-galactosidase-1-like protein 2 isoform X2 [Danio rerio]